MPVADEEGTSGDPREATIAELEATLDHFFHDSEAATELAIRSPVDPARFGAGRLIRALPRAVRRSAAFRIAWSRGGRRAARVNRAIADRSAGDMVPEDWSTRAPIPVKTFEARAAVVGEQLYVFGGFRPPHVHIEASNWRFDPAANRWESLAPMPTPVTHAAIGVFGDEVWVVGGFVGNNPGPATRAVQIYDTRDDRWRSGPPLPVHRASLAAAVDGTRLHVMGGLGLDRHSDRPDHLVIDTALGDWSHLAPLPPPGRNHHSAIGVNGRLYVVSGHTGHDGPLVDLRTVDSYDPDTDTWHRVADLPESRHHCEASTFVWRGRVTVAGGLGPGRRAPLPDLVSYDPDRNVWETSGLLPVPLWGAVVQPVGGDLIATSGSTSTFRSAINDTWAFSSPDEPGIGTSPLV